jgi:hypothetical protein
MALLITIAVSFHAGCAIHYYDESTGTEHILGLGHMKMKIAAPNEGLQACVQGTDVLGFSVGKAYRQLYLTVGKHSLQRLDVVAESTAVRLEWPDADYVNVRVGSAFPGLPDSVTALEKEDRNQQCPREKESEE